MITFRKNEWEKILKLHWFPIYRTLWITGGLSGGILFYRKTECLINTYLTNHGFSESHIIAELERVAIFFIGALFLLTCLSMFIQLFFSYMKKRYVVRKWLIIFFGILSSVGYLVAFINIWMEPLNELLFFVWFIFTSIILPIPFFMQEKFKSVQYVNGRRTIIKECDNQK